MMKTTLEHTGEYEVCTVSDSRTARRVALEFHPDVVLMDIMMPHADGGEVACCFRADPLLQDVPIIFMSAMIAPSESRDGAMCRGGERFLSKPVRREAVLESLVRVLRPVAA